MLCSSCSTTLNNVLLQDQRKLVLNAYKLVSEFFAFAQVWLWFTVLLNNMEHILVMFFTPWWSQEIRAEFHASFCTLIYNIQRPQIAESTPAKSASVVFIVMTGGNAGLPNPAPNRFLTLEEQSLV